MKETNSQAAFCEDVADALLIAAQLQVEGHTEGTMDMACEILGFEPGGHEYECAFQSCCRANIDLQRRGVFTGDDDGIHTVFLEAALIALHIGKIEGPEPN